MTSALLATAFVATFTATPLHARSLALTNADVTRLLARRASDQTVIVMIHEAQAPHFDLSASAVSDLAFIGVSSTVIAEMDQPSTLWTLRLAARDVSLRVIILAFGSSLSVFQAGRAEAEVHLIPDGYVMGVLRQLTRPAPDGALVNDE